MKTSFYMISKTFLLCTLLFACTKDAIMEDLMQAEKQMEANPDSALIILKEIEKKIGDNRLPETLSKKQYALWCLLLTQAQDKNYITQTSDSLIQVAVDYFEKKKDKRYLMKAYYYNAVIYHDLGDSPRAQEYYLKALDAGKSTADHAMLGRIYANLGSMYIYQNLAKEAKTCQEKALASFLITNDSVNIGMTQRNIGRIYSQSGILDSAVVSYLKAMPYLSKRDPFIYNEIGGIYKRLEEYQKAFEYIELTLASLTDDNDMYTIYYNLGDLYRRTGSYDSARYYLSLALTSSDIYTRSGANLSLSFLEEKQGNYQTGFKCLEQHLHLQDSINNTKRSRDLKNIESLYNYNLVKKERNFYEWEANKKTIHMYLSAIFTFAFIIIFILLHLYNRRFKKDNKEKRLRLEEMKWQVEKQPRIAGMDKKINALKANPFCQKIITNKTKANDADWEALIEEIEKLYPNFTYHLKTLYPEIKKEDLRVCCLKKIDIPVNRIADVFNKSSQGISNQRNRLYEKLTGNKGTATDLDKFLHEL